MQVGNIFLSQICKTKKAYVWITYLFFMKSQSTTFLISVSYVRMNLFMSVQPNGAFICINNPTINATINSLGINLYIDKLFNHPYGDPVYVFISWHISRVW